MYNAENYWDKIGTGRIQKVMEDAGIPEETIAAIISEMDDVAWEIRSEAQNDGAAQESYANSMSYMND
jgi:hypothetical protein